MACRVGMTTNPADRKSHWQNKVNGFRNWRILASGLTYDQAETREKSEAKSGGCDHGSGGQRVSGAVWSVYKFEFDSYK